jgi:hypothetical protein
MSRWLPAGIAAALLFGCAEHPQVADTRTVHLPQPDREAILNARHQVDVAQANVTSAQVALDEAKQFDTIADHELHAAKSHLEAARKGVELGRAAQSGETLESAQAELILAQRQLFAAKAKQDYADQLVELRKAQVDEAEAALDEAHADTEYAKLEALQRNDMAAGLDAAKFIRAREKAHNKVADKRMKVATLEGTVARLRTTWDEELRNYNTAMREHGYPTIGAPPPPARLPEDENR